MIGVGIIAYPFFIQLLNNVPSNRGLSSPVISTIDFASKDI